MCIGIYGPAQGYLQCDLGILRYMRYSSRGSLDTTMVSDVLCGRLAGRVDSQRCVCDTEARKRCTYDV